MGFFLCAEEFFLVNRFFLFTYGFFSLGFSPKVFNLNSGAMQVNFIFICFRIALVVCVVWLVWYVRTSGGVQCSSCVVYVCCNVVCDSCTPTFSVSTCTRADILNV